MDGYTEIFAIDGCPELYGRFTRSCHVLSQEKLESVCRYYLIRNSQVVKKGCSPQKSMMKKM